MNEAVLTQPITAGDLAALSGALSAPAVTQTQAQNTYIKMLVQMQMHLKVLHPRRTRYSLLWPPARSPRLIKRFTKRSHSKQ